MEMVCLKIIHELHLIGFLDYVIKTKDSIKMLSPKIEIQIMGFVIDILCDPEFPFKICFMLP